MMRILRLGVLSGLLVILLLFSASLHSSCEAVQLVKIENHAFVLGGVSFNYVPAGEQPILTIKDGYSLRNSDPSSVYCHDFYISKSAITGDNFAKFFSSHNIHAKINKAVFSDPYELALLLEHLRRSYKLTELGKEVDGWFGIASSEDLQRALLPNKLYKRGVALTGFHSNHKHLFSNRISYDYTMPEGYSTYPFAVGSEDIRRGLVISGPKEGNVLGWPTDIDRKLMSMDPQNAKDNSCGRFWPLNISRNQGAFYLKFVLSKKEDKL